MYACVFMCMYVYTCVYRQYLKNKRDELFIRGPDLTSKIVDSHIKSRYLQSSAVTYVQRTDRVGI